MITMPQCEAVHSLYVIHSGMDVKFTIHHMFAWEMFLHDFNEADVVMVAKFLRSEIRRPGSKMTLACLKFRNLIEDLPAFADHRAMALASATIKAKERARGPATASEKAEALRESKPVPERTTGTVAPISQHVAGLLARWKEDHR